MKWNPENTTRAVGQQPRVVVCSVRKGGENRCQTKRLSRQSGIRNENKHKVHFLGWKNRWKNTKTKQIIKRQLKIPGQIVRESKNSVQFVRFHQHT